MREWCGPRSPPAAARATIDPTDPEEGSHDAAPRDAAAQTPRPAGARTVLAAVAALLVSAGLFAGFVATHPRGDAAPIALLLMALLVGTGVAAGQFRHGPLALGGLLVSAHIVTLAIVWGRTEACTICIGSGELSRTEVAVLSSYMLTFALSWAAGAAVFGCIVGRALARLRDLDA